MQSPASKTILTSPYIELNNQGQMVHFDLTQPVHRLGRDSTWADLIVPEQGWGVISGQHIVFRREGNQYRIQDGDGKAKPSTNGLFMNHTRVQTQPGLLLNKNAQLQIGQNPQNMILLNYVLKPSVPMTANASQLRLNLRSVSSEVALGRDLSGVPGAIAMTLDAPSVSRHHSSVTKENGGYVLRDRSTNGTYLNRKRITTARPLQDGDIIQIGPFTLVFRNEILEIFDKGDKIRIDALNLVR